MQHRLFNPLINLCVEPVAFISFWQFNFWHFFRFWCFKHLLTDIVLQDHIEWGWFVDLLWFKDQRFCLDHHGSDLWRRVDQVNWLCHEILLALGFLDVLVQQVLVCLAISIELHRFESALGHLFVFAPDACSMLTNSTDSHRCPRGTNCHCASRDTLWLLLRQLWRLYPYVVVGVLHWDSRIVRIINWCTAPSLRMIA